MGTLLSVLLMLWGNLTGAPPHMTFDQLVHASVQAKQAALEQARLAALPYTPQFAAKDAEPLKKHYTQDTLAQMPHLEAHGDTRKRSVPFGQTLLNGKTDKTNGPLKKYRVVSFYGTPESSAMGILGEYTPDVLIKKLKAQTRAYTDLDPSHPAIPALEMIATVAQRSPGPHGLYISRPNDKDIEKYAKLAKDNGAILVLDVQLGHDTIMHQVQSLEKYLKLPYVTLAIDTEFHVRAGQVPGVVLGHVDGNHVEQAIQYVNDLIVKNHLPDKFVVVHQFRDDIIRNKSAIKPTDHTEVVLNGDGFGTPGQKMAGYHLLVRDEPVQYGGFKLFYKEDYPVLTPKDVLTLDPAPAFINYE